MLLQRVVDHDAEVVAQRPLLVRLHKSFARPIWHIPTRCAVLVNPPDSLVARMLAKSGDRGFALCLYGGFEADAVDVEYVFELGGRE